MAHFITAWTTEGGVPPAWPPLSTITPAHWWVIDSSSYASINGDVGGTWEPSGYITIGGAGMWFAGGTVLGVGSYINGAITFGSGDFFMVPATHPGFSRTIVTPCVARRGTMSNTATAAVASLVGTRIVLPLSVHNGAVLQVASLTYRIPTIGQCPINQIRFRLVQVDALGNVTALTRRCAWISPTLGLQTTATFDYQGFASTNTTYAGSYYGLGQTQSLLIYPFAFIDTTKYRYYAEIIDASGPGILGATAAVAGDIFLDVACTFINILDTHFQ